MARAVKTVQVDTVRDRTRSPRDASIPALEARLPAASQPATEKWWATLSDGTIVNVVSGAWQAQSTGAVAGTVVNVTAALSAAAMPATIAALEAMFPASGRPAGVVWEGTYGTGPNTATARVVDGAWVPVDVPTVGTVRNVTPAAIPANLAALETAVPAAGQPTDEAWFALTGTGPTFRTAAVVAGTWRYVDGPGGALIRETLTVVARNTINPLANTPTGTVEFQVNGVATTGITNSGTTVTVAPATVGFNVDPGVDQVVAEYPI